MVQFLRAAQPGQYQAKRSVLFVAKLFRQFNLVNGKRQRAALDDVVHAAFKKNMAHIFWQRTPDQSVFDIVTALAADTVVQHADSRILLYLRDPAVLRRKRKALY